MNRPVIFLDFDGVLNTEQYQAQLATEGKPTKDVWGPLFALRPVANLKKIIEATDAEIVISSSWRYMFRLGSLRMMWETRDLPGEIRGALACGATYISRGEEIECWLKQNEVPNYVIIDDLDDFSPTQHDRYVEINPIVGITETDAENAIKILSQSLAERRKASANSEAAVALRDWFEQIPGGSISIMQKRYSLLSDIVKDYTNIEDFAREKVEFFEMMGVELDKSEKCVSLYFPLDYNEYEQFFVVPTRNERLAVSHIIYWQNEICANEILNIFTGETYDDDDVIFTNY